MYESNIMRTYMHFVKISLLPDPKVICVSSMNVCCYLTVTGLHLRRRIFLSLTVERGNLVAF